MAVSDRLFLPVDKFTLETGKATVSNYQLSKYTPNRLNLNKGSPQNARVKLCLLRI